MVFMVFVEEDLEAIVTVELQVEVKFNQKGAQEHLHGTALFQTTGDQKTSRTSNISGVSVSGTCCDAVDTYVNVEICGQVLPFLCDSGAEFNIVLCKVVPDAKLENVTVDLFTASGQRIEVLGKVWFEFKIDGKIFIAEFLVRDYVRDAILGYQFLRENDCCRSFSDALIVIKGVKVKLVNKPSCENCRQVYERVYDVQKCEIEVFSEIFFLQTRMYVRCRVDAEKGGESTILTASWCMLAG